jgi:Fur family ferric uptake transcriptional regulator
VRTDVIPRNTRQRTVILETVRTLGNHPSADEVFEAVRHKLPRVSLSTVYRNLEFLANSGLIRKLEMGGLPVRFDSTVSPHFHIRCISCNRIDDLRGRRVVVVEDARDFDHDYEVLGYQVEFIGLCSNCRAESSPHHEPSAC